MLSEDKKSETEVKSFCCGCLSVGRTLRKLDQFAETWNNILDDSAQMTQDILICWECRVLLKKVLTFKHNVLQAQQLLFDHSIGLEDDPKSLSHLTITSLGCLNVEDTDIQHEEAVIIELIKPEIKMEEPSDNRHFDDDKQKEDKKCLNIGETQYGVPIVTEDTKSKLKIKEESSDNEDYQTSLNDNGDEGSTESDDSANEMKKEKTLNKEVTQKKENAQKIYKKSYRVVINPVKPVIVKREIRYSELNYWLEEDKNSEYYKIGKFRCDKCLIVYKSGVAVKKHNELIHVPTSNRRYLCDICHTYIARKPELENHIKGHYYIRKCTMCGYTCNGVKNMAAHVKAHKKCVQCLECQHWLSDVQGFRKHYELHKLFVCDYCHKKCLTKKVLEKHIFRKHRIHKCKTCNRVYQTYETYCEHLRYKHEVSPTEVVFCVLCNKQFRNKRQFQVHLAKTTAHAHERNTPKRKYQCPGCEKQYSKVYSMKLHYNLVHLNKSKHYCRLCDKKFINGDGYRRHHMVVHEGYVRPKNKICNVCGKGFRDNRVLDNHMRTHTGERPFACTECDARFAQKVALTSHIKFIHLKNRRKPAKTAEMDNFNA